MPKIEEPVTRATVEARAGEWANDPASVVEITHEGFNADPHSGGYAFLCDKGLLIHCRDGSTMQSVDPVDDISPIGKVDQYWRQAQHRNRTLLLADLNPWHQAVISALAAGLESVGALSSCSWPGVADGEVDQADYLLVFLRRYSHDSTQAAALRALARNDWPMELSPHGPRAHPCPICGLPAIGETWGFVTVCDKCHPQAVCTHHRIVSGTNTSIFGGFKARHVDDMSSCGQVSSDGRCWIHGTQCHMGEAKFGGVFIGIRQGDSDDASISRSSPR